MIECTCKECGKVFAVPYKCNIRDYCSKSCAQKVRWRHTERKVKEFTCEACGKVFQVPISDHRLKEGKKIRFCSPKCCGEFNKGTQRVKNGESIVIYPFMINELELKTVELIIYAVIYAEQRERGYYDKTLSYLANWTNCTIQGVIKALKSLQSKGFIKREEVFNNSVKKIKYWCVQEA